uniref:NADH-ubiquinone oxidoreductase chain 4L n=1 Tax=Erpobdella japonica TaxID=184739 RepID=A0A343KJQ8_9ANNE|nr:NADH dehydrogenase subunit 4L [Erpobdella japonica]ATG87482.1 NADH dehydrogenase subunit 4L [Erpobdella japonica]
MSYMVILMIPLITIMNLLLHHKYLLLTLLSLEAITLTLIFIMNSSYMMMGMNFSIVSILILTVGACEASLGLTLLVLMSRFYGNDLVKNLSMSKC